MPRIATDNHIRDMLDLVGSARFDPLFLQAIEVVEPGGGLSGFRRPGYHMLVACDGMEYYGATKLHCPCRSTRKRSGGGT
jgi:hypothetical protein